MPWRTCVDNLNRKDIQNNERSECPLQRTGRSLCICSANTAKAGGRASVPHRETQSEPLTRRYYICRGERVLTI